MSIKDSFSHLAVSFIYWQISPNRRKCQWVFAAISGLKSPNGSPQKKYKIKEDTLHFALSFILFFKVP